MSTAGNFFETERKAFDLRTKLLVTSSSVTTYTARVGGASDNFVIDRVIRVETVSGNAMNISVPDGKYYGQRLLVIHEVRGGSDDVDVTTILGDNATTMTGAGGYSDLVWMGSTLGWVELSSEAT